MMTAFLAETNPAMIAAKSQHTLAQMMVSVAEKVGKST